MGSDLRWLRILTQTARRAFDDGVTTIASGVAFFVVLAVFPGTAAIVALYSLFAGPSLGETLLGTLPSVLPDYAVQVITRQVRYTSAHGAEAKRLGIASAVGFAALLLSTNRGTIALFRGLSVVYGEAEQRGFLALLGASLVFTVGAIVFLVFSIGAVVLLPGVLRGLGWGLASAHIVDLLRWPVLLVVVGLALATLYRFGPSRTDPDWRCIALGSSVASLLWVCGSLLFSFVVSQLGRFDELYGSVGAMIGFMLWIWLSITVVLVGAELDSTAWRTAKEPDIAPQPPTSG
jgi:membrane protein